VPSSQLIVGAAVSFNMPLNADLGERALFAPLSPLKGKTSIIVGASIAKDAAKLAHERV